MIGNLWAESEAETKLSIIDIQLFRTFKLRPVTSCSAYLSFLRRRFKSVKLKNRLSSSYFKLKSSARQGWSSSLGVWLETDNLTVKTYLLINRRSEVKRGVLHYNKNREQDLRASIWPKSFSNGDPFGPQKPSINLFRGLPRWLLPLGRTRHTVDEGWC